MRSLQRNDRFIRVLESCHALARESVDSPHSHLTAEEICDLLRTSIQQLQNGERPDLYQLRMLFAPTSALQETAMDNGWGDDYLRLADQFDQFVPRA